MLRRLLALALPFAAVLIAGCMKAPPPPPPPPPPEVVVAPAIVQTVTDTEEFTGRTEASETVEVRAHVTGYLEKSFLVEMNKEIPPDSKEKYVREGSDIEKGVVLFLIDPMLLQAEVNRAKANLSSAVARAERLQDDYDRFRRASPNSISPIEMSKVEGDLKEARAAVKSAEAALNYAQVNLAYATVSAPISGRVSRRLVDPGNTVKADETALTYIANLDPIHVFFDVDERTYLRLYRDFIGRGFKLDDLKQYKVRLGLADERGKYPHEGVVNFVDTRVDPNTGSVWVRAVVPNPTKFLTPGLFVRVQMPISDPHPAVLVPEKALGTDQGQKYLFVVNDKNVAEYRRVKIGGQHGQLREILKPEPGEPYQEVKAGERVVVSGLQRVRPGTPVTPKEEGAKDKDQGSEAKGQ